MTDIFPDREGWWVETDCLPLGPYDTYAEACDAADCLDDPDMVEA